MEVPGGTTKAFSCELVSQNGLVSGNASWRGLTADLRIMAVTVSGQYTQFVSMREKERSLQTKNSENVPNKSLLGMSWDRPRSLPRLGHVLPFSWVFHLILYTRFSQILCILYYTHIIYHVHLQVVAKHFLLLDVFFGAR